MRVAEINLGGRLLDFAAEIIKLTNSPNSTYNGRHIAGQ